MNIAVVSEALTPRLKIGPGDDRIAHQAVERGLGDADGISGLLDRVLDVQRQDRLLSYPAFYRHVPGEKAHAMETHNSRSVVALVYEYCTVMMNPPCHKTHDAE